MSCVGCRRLFGADGVDSFNSVADADMGDTCDTGDTDATLLVY